MSLVGTRPPTMDEWEKYELHHRKRLAIKPGLTGMWQVSGRSDITDFEEVVELDTKYIAEWCLKSWYICCNDEPNNNFPGTNGNNAGTQGICKCNFYCQYSVNYNIYI